MKTMEELLKEFQFDYIGGGYFRKKGFDKGQAAPILHGQAIIEEVIKFTLQQTKQTKN